MFEGRDPLRDFFAISSLNTGRGKCSFRILLWLSAGHFLEKQDISYVQVFNFFQIPDFPIFYGSVHNLNQGRTDSSTRTFFIRKNNCPNSCQQPLSRFDILKFCFFLRKYKNPPTPFIFREFNLERCEFSHIHLALGLYDLINEHTKTSQVHEFGNNIPDEWKRPWTNNLKVMAGLLVARNVWRTDRNNIFGVKLKNPQNF